MNIVWRPKSSLGRKSLETIYFYFILSLLGYAVTVWNNYTQYEANEIEKKIPIRGRMDRNRRHQTRFD